MRQSASESRHVPRVPGAWFVIIAAICWGTTGTAQAFAPVEATPIAVGVIRLAVGGSLLLLWALVRGAFVAERRWPMRSTLLAAFCMAVYQLCFFAGVARTGVAVGTVVAIGSAPVIAGLLAWAVRREAPNWVWAVATLLAIAGCTLLGLQGGGVTLDGVGLLLALGAGGSYATYVLASKALVAAQRPEAAMGVVFGLGALMLLPLFWSQDFGWLLTPSGLGVALHLGLVTVAVAYVLFAQGLTRTSVATAVTLTLAEPLTATLLGVVVVRESLDMTAGLGVALLLAGLIWVAVQTRRSSSPARSGENAVVVRNA